MKFLVAAIILVLLAGTFHVLFIVYDYAYNNPDSGGFILAQEALNDSLNPYYRNWVNNRTIMMRQFFGIGRVILLALCIVMFVAEVFTRAISKKE